MGETSFAVCNGPWCFPMIGMLVAIALGLVVRRIWPK